MRPRNNILIYIEKIGDNYKPASKDWIGSPAYDKFAMTLMLSVMARSKATWPSTESAPLDSCLHKNDIHYLMSSSRMRGSTSDLYLSPCGRGHRIAMGEGAYSDKVWIASLRSQ